MRAVNLGRWRPQEEEVLGPEVVGSNPTGPTNRDFFSLHGHVPSQSFSQVLPSEVSGQIKDRI